MTRFAILLSGLVLLMTMLSGAVGAAPQLPIYSLQEKISGEDLEEFLRGGVRWGDGNEFWFHSDGKTQRVLTDFSKSAMEPDICRCVPPVDRLVSANGIQFTCNYQCNATHSQFVSGEKRDLVSGREKSFLLRPLFVSREAFAYRDQERARAVAYRCEPDTGNVTISRMCAVEYPRRTTFFLEIIPGAKDPALLGEVRMRLQQMTGDLREDAFLFQGPQAKKPRTASEIFFANERRDAAERIARLLEPAVGRIDVRPWPGRWDYDVVVVVGARKLAEGMPSAGPN